MPEILLYDSLGKPSRVRKDVHVRLTTVKKFMHLRPTTISQTPSPSQGRFAKYEERRYYSEPGYYHSILSQVRFVEDKEK